MNAIEQEKFKVGEAATICLISDRYPATVIGVGKRGSSMFITVQQDTDKVISGSAHDGSAEYEYTRNPEGRTWTFRLRNGKLEQVSMNPESGRFVKSGFGIGLHVGSRRRYYDPHF